MEVDKKYAYKARMKYLFRWSTACSLWCEPYMLHATDFSCRESVRKKRILYKK